MLRLFIGDDFYLYNGDMSAFQKESSETEWISVDSGECFIREILITKIVVVKTTTK